MKTNKYDIGAMLAKGGVGAIPYVGPIISEIIGELIPNQRLDRIQKFLEKLELKISELEQEKVKEKFTTPESIDLLEDSFIMASRSLSDERKEYIASLFKNSLNDDQLKHIEYKKMLSLLGQLNDIEVLLLKSYTLHRYDFDPRYDAFVEKHKEVLTPPKRGFDATQEELDKSAIFGAYKNHLISLNLASPKYQIKKGELPEYDNQSGLPKSYKVEATSLGRLLLKSIDIIEGIS